MNARILKRFIILFITLPPMIISLLMIAPSPKVEGQYSNPQLNLIIQPRSIASEMLITGNGKGITHCCNNPSTADYTDFGNMDIDNNPLSRTFVIHNTGLNELNLNSQPTIIISGPQAEDFQITGYPPASIAGGSSAPLEITFRPREAGIKTATVSITSNDPQKSLYRFFIRGKGTRAIKTKINGASDESPKTVTTTPPAINKNALALNITIEGRATIDADNGGFLINLRPNLENQSNSTY